MRAALGFLTRVPVGIAHLDDSALARSVRWFPFVGALIGAAVTAVYVVTTEILPSLPAAAIAVGSGILLTGAFHEDGLADVADAVGAHDREDVRRILKDPRLGTFGVLAVVAVFVVRVAALAAMDRWTAIAIVPAAHALARAAAVASTRRGTPSSDPGLGTAYATAVTKTDVMVAVISALAIAAALSGLWAIALVGLVSLGAAAFTRMAISKLGSPTGDFLGAIEQMGEAGGFLLGAAIAFNGWAAAAWWR